MDINVPKDPTDNKETDTDTPVWQYYVDLARATGHVLLIKAAGWKQFCSDMNVPPFLLWEPLPGFDRLMRALDDAEKTSFKPDEFVRWLNSVRLKGNPEFTAALLSPKGPAAFNAAAYRERVRWWSV